MDQVRRSPKVIESVTVFLSAVMGCLALTTPISLAWAQGTASLQMELLVYSLPKATAVGGIAAMITVAFATTAGSTLTAWAMALGGSMILLANHLLGRNFSGFAPLTTLNYVDCLAGGIVLGGVLSASQHRRLLMLLVALGAMSALMLSDLGVADAEFTGSAGDSPIGWFVIDSPSLVLIAPTTALIVVCAYLHENRRPEDPLLSVEVPLRPILATLVLATSVVAGTSWLVRYGSTPYEALPVALLTVAAALICALLLPQRDGEMVLCAVAVAGAGGATLLMPLTGWMIPMLLAVGVSGMVLGTYRPMPLAAIVGAIGLAVLALLAADANGPNESTSVAGSLVLTLLVGYSLASTLPRESGAVALLLALLVLCLPGVTVAVRARIFGVGFALPRRWEAPGAYGDTSDVLLFAMPGVVALVVTIGCALAVLVLRRIRPPPPVTAAGGDAPAATGEGGAQDPAQRR